MTITADKLERFVADSERREAEASAPTMDAPSADEMVPSPGLGTHTLNSAPTLSEMLAEKKAGLKSVDTSEMDQRAANQKEREDEDYRFDSSLMGNDATNTEVLGRIAKQKETVETKNDVTDEMIADFLSDREKAIEKWSMTPMQIATATARNEGADIADPSTLFDPDEIKSHLGEFANGAHAFIDPWASDRIEGMVEDEKFKGWGRDANFVAPLAEAAALNSKAHNQHGIVTLEDDLGIPKRAWSRSGENPAQELIRWVIPKPKVDIKEAKTGGILLTMATGKETGADPKAWVAGGLTKGGAHEARMDAIPRADLITALSTGEIKRVVEKYPETPIHNDEKYKVGDL